MDYMELLRMPQAEVNHMTDIYEGAACRYNDAGQRRRIVGVADIPRLVTERPSAVGSQYGPIMTTPKIGKLLYDEEVPYATGTGTRMSLIIQIVVLDRERVPLMTEWEHVASCGDCKGSSGGCPGFAPRFPFINPRVPALYLFVVTLDMAWAVEHTTKKVHNTGLSIPWANRITAGYTRRILSALKQNKAGVYVLGLGSCAGSWHKCRPSCKVIIGDRCQYPDLRSFSMEAVGIDCDMLHYKLYGERLPWAYYGVKGLPTYMTRYAGALAWASDYRDIVGALASSISADKSRTFKCVPPVPVYDAKFMSVPSSYYKKCTQGFYMFGTERLYYDE